MMPIIKLLNKIKWDDRENPDDYELGYYDRVEDKLIWIKYNTIQRMDGMFMILIGEVCIPTHRIKVVKNQDKVVWEREIK